MVALEPREVAAVIAERGFVLKSTTLCDLCDRDTDWLALYPHERVFLCNDCAARYGYLW